MNQRKWLRSTNATANPNESASFVAIQGIAKAHVLGNMAFHTTRSNEDRIGQLDDRKVPQVAHIHCMAEDTEQGQPERKPVNESKEHLGPYDGIDQSREELPREHGVFLDELRKIIQSGSCVDRQRTTSRQPLRAL